MQSMAILIAWPLPARQPDRQENYGRSVIEFEALKTARTRRSPNIVFADCQIKTRCRCGAGGICSIKEMCSAGSRVLVETPILMNLWWRQRKAQRYQVGDPLDPARPAWARLWIAAISTGLGVYRWAAKRTFTLLLGGDAQRMESGYLMSLRPLCQPDSRLAHEGTPPGQFAPSLHSKTRPKRSRSAEQPSDYEAAAHVDA